MERGEAHRLDAAAGGRGDGKLVAAALIREAPASRINSAPLSARGLEAMERLLELPDCFF